MVCRIVERLLAAGVPSQEIGIITPYKAQQALIRKRLLKRAELAGTLCRHCGSFPRRERES